MSQGTKGLPLCFIADAMLGRLARWLRLLGFDTLYYPHIRDGDLLRLALQEGRVILTRDSHFLGIKNLKNLFLVRSDDPTEQTIEVLKAFDIRESGPGRCARCNGPLDHVEEKESIRDLVPEYVFFHGTGFSRCRVCSNVYWEGTHLKRFREQLGSAIKLR